MFLVANTKGKAAQERKIRVPCATRSPESGITNRILGDYSGGTLPSPVSLYFLQVSNPLIFWFRTPQYVSQ